MSAPLVFDAIVVGGGPAGACAATLLATWGHNVVLLERTVGGGTALGESLPPSVRPLLQRVGAMDAASSAGVPSTGNSVWWGPQADEGAPRVERFTGGRTGLQVDRALFDVALRAGARVAGVTVLQPAVAHAIAPIGESHRVAADGSAGPFHLEAPWVLDCTGRAGLAARRSRVMVSGQPRTLAVAGFWERPGGWASMLPDDSHTLVESAPWGWAWSVPVRQGRRCVAVMLDPDELRGRSLGDVYRQRVGALHSLGEVTRQAAAAGDPFACDASTYESATDAPDGVLFVGDASSFLDPLSSFGVKKALASAWLAAVVVHTALVSPGTAAAARTLYHERERAFVRAVAGPLRLLSRDVDEGTGEFWGPRAALDDDQASMDPAQVLRGTEAVQRAFAHLREHGYVAAVGLTCPVVRRPTVRGHEVVEADHVVLTGVPEPVRYLRNIDLVELHRAMAGGTEVGTLYERYTRAIGPAELPDFLGAVAVLVAEGLARVVGPGLLDRPGDHP